MAVFTRAMILLIFLYLSCLSEGREYLVGGKSDAWKIPSSPSDSLNQWAQSSRFLIGDYLGMYRHNSLSLIYYFCSSYFIREYIMT